MGMHTTKVAVGEGKFALEAQLAVTPRGMAVYACSPEYAHLGATAQAIPRPEPGRTATVSILAVPCHRDEIPAHDIAAALATRFGVPVVASTGFHVEHATADDLQRVLATTKELIAALEEAAARILRAGWDEGGAGAEVVAVDVATGEALGPVDRIGGPYRRGNPASGISDASGRGPGRRRAPAALSSQSAQTPVGRGAGR